MIVPQFWAEGRIQTRDGQRQVTVRRWGWSDASQADAQAHANARTQAALEQILSGVKLNRRELKRAYNGAEGVPIREEIVERRGENVITRNSYGARCLNTPNVLFADVDFSVGPGAGITCLFMLVYLIAAITAGIWLRSWLYGGLLASLALIAGRWSAIGIDFLRSAICGNAEVRALAAIHRFAANSPDWHLRVYRTPNGLRLLAMQRAFDPLEPDVATFFAALGIDPIYALMCRNQRCFRARLSAKPWRIGVADHIRPRRAVWPVAAEYREPRETWVAEYEAAARDFAACRFIESVGNGIIHPAARSVQQWHDELSRAESGLPIA